MKPLYLLLATSALLISTPSQAQMYSGDYQKCNRGSTPQIEQCVGKQTKMWDNRLNKAYKELMSRSSDAQKEPLRTTQRLWIQYRDANCNFYSAGDGTISRVQAAECRRYMTLQRTCEMEAANNWEGGTQPGCD